MRCINCKSINVFKFVDGFGTDELSPLVPAFLKGAHIIYAHSALQRHARLGYTGNWALRNFPDNAARNHFFEKIGKNLPPEKQSCLNDFNEETKPEKIINKIKSL